MIATSDRIAPRPVLCVTAHEHRDIRRADAVTEGRFELIGQTLTLGTEPDWLGAELPADEEWRIEWVKFAYGNDLAYAYEQTGAPHYPAAWERLVGSWIRQVEPDHDPAEVTARRILNWIYAWQAFGAAGAEPAPGLDAALLRSIARQARHVRENLAPQRNHRTLELYALMIAALALPDLDPGGALLGEAVRQLGRNLESDFRPDGVHIEASTHYHLIALRSFVGARENARRYGVSLPGGFEDRLQRACDFAVHCRRPDGRIPALSDADQGDYDDLLELAGADMSPRATNVDFPDGGYHVQRSGWDRDARFLIFDCGPLGEGGHGHYDLLSFEAFAHGRPLVVDPGRFTYSEAPPNLRRWFRGTAAHSTVTVDGLDQTPYTRTRPKGPVAEGRFLGRTTRPGLDVLEGEARSPAYEAVHRRRIAFVANRYWVIEDHLSGEREHRYDLRFHLAAADAEIVGTTVRAPGLALAILGAERIDLESGWISPRYGERHEAVVVSAVATGTAASFVSLMTPLEP
jgi:uncharacterized heparinase superfamily protein